MNEHERLAWKAKMANTSTETNTLDCLMRLADAWPMLHRDPSGVKALVRQLIPASAVAIPTNWIVETVSNIEAMMFPEGAFVLAEVAVVLEV